MRQVAELHGAFEAAATLRESLATRDAQLVALQEQFDATWRERDDLRRQFAELHSRTLDQASSDAHPPSGDKIASGGAEQADRPQHPDEALADQDKDSVRDSRIAQLEECLAAARRERDDLASRITDYKTDGTHYLVEMRALNVELARRATAAERECDDLRGHFTASVSGW